MHEWATPDYKNYGTMLVINDNSNYERKNVTLDDFIDYKSSGIQFKNETDLDFYGECYLSLRRRLQIYYAFYRWRGLQAVEGRG